MSAKTVKEALTSLEQAAAANDPEAFVAGIDPVYADAYRGIIGVLMSFRAAAEGVVNAAEARYGAEAVAEVREALREFAMPSPLACVACEGCIDWTQVRIKEAGDRASVFVDDYPMADLHKVGDGWVVLPQDLAGRSVEELNAETAEKRQQTAESVAALGALEKLVAAGSVGPDELMQRIGEAMG